MKIALGVTGKYNSAVISSEFTGAEYFLIVNTEDRSLMERLENRYSRFPAAAEIFCPQLLLSKGIDRIICCKCAPNAKRIFKEAKVDVIENAEGSVTAHISSFPNRFQTDPPSPSL